MASHFTDIGFVVASTDDLVAMSRSLPPGTPVIQTGVGDLGGTFWMSARFPDLAA